MVATKLDVKIHQHGNLNQPLERVLLIQIAWELEE